ncbi:LptF/LptG family permease [Deinococcus sonorensis]|uniref:LptF/LptG family permease n=2 Tax=Deinococcus sonorensis TaxID=309891 RepID=A0AAU7U7D7_9DEIO
MPRVSRKLPLYVLREVLPWYLGGLLLFLSLQMTDSLTSTVGYLITYRVGLGQGLLLFLNQLPLIFNRCLVLAVPFAVLLAFGRLAKDSEFKAMFSAGVAPTRALWPLLLPAAVIGVFAWYNAGWLTPATQARWWNAWYGVYGVQPPPPSQDRYAFAQGDTLFTAGRVQNDRHSQSAQLIGVLIQRGQETYTASSGVWDAAKQTWSISNGWVVGQDGVPRQMVAPLTLPQHDVLKQPPTPPNQTSTPALRARLAADQTDSPDRRDAAFELSRRSADPVTPLAFALAAGALGLLIRNRAWAAGSVILFIFSFYVLWSTVPQLAREGALTPDLAAWLPNLVFISLGLLLTWRLR